MDAVPGFSQVKSLFQWLSGNSRGAVETQINFSKRCPVLSQGISTWQCLSGDTNGAIETQIIFFKGLSSIADSVPFLAHAIAGVLHMLVDYEGAPNALGVIAGWTVGFFLGGPMLAGAGGVLGGVLTDVSISIQTDKIGEQISPTLKKRKLADTDISSPVESMNEFNANKKMKSHSTHVITEAKDQIPIPNLELQTRVPNATQVSTTTCHGSQATVNISLSQNSSAMRSLISVAVETGAVAGAAIRFGNVRPNVIPREEP